MSRDLSRQEMDACLLSLERALVMARDACAQGDVEKAEALIDAFHNLPRLLLGKRSAAGTADWSLRSHNELFLAPLLERYPTLRGSGVDLTVSPGPDPTDP
jgi:hypothetical protein